MLTPKVIQNGIATLLLSVVFTSCSLYKPAKLNAPMLIEKGDGNLSASIGRTFDVNASYSPADHFGILANYSDGFSISKTTTDQTTNQSIVVYEYDNKQFEIAGGYYNYIEDQFYVELYSGYGFGEAASSDFLISSSIFENDAYSAKFENVFIQGTIANDPREDISFGLTSKLARLSFYDFEYSFDTPPTSNFFDQRVHYIIQTAGTARYQTSAIGFEVQAGVTIADEDRFFSSRLFNISIGLNFNLSQLKAQ